MVDRIQQKVQAVTSMTTPTGAITAGAGAFTLNEWLAIGGFALALGSFGVNWYYQHKRYQLQKADQKGK